MKEKISNFSFLTIIYSISSASFYGITSAYLFEKGNTSLVISILLGYIISLLISIIYLKIFSYKENLSFVNKLKQIYKKFHYIPNTIIIIASISLYIIATNRLVTFLSTQYLIETSKVIILFLVVMTTYYTASKGIETISRVSSISFFISLTIFMFNLLSLIKHINIENYFPIITVSKSTILETSLVYALFFTGPIFYMNSICKNELDKKEKITKQYYLIHLVSFLIVSLGIITTLGVYGINLCKIFDYPLYTVLKKISLFNFIDAVENTSISLWIISTINTSTIVLYFTLQSIKETFNQNNKIIDYIVVAISLIIPIILFNKSNFLESFDYIKVPIIVLIIPIIISLISLILKKNTTK